VLLLLFGDRIIDEASSVVRSMFVFIVTGAVPPELASMLDGRSVVISGQGSESHY